MIVGSSGRVNLFMTSVTAKQANVKALNIAERG
jgi:hypothetical protein